MSLSIRLHHRLPEMTLDLAIEARAGLTGICGRSGAGKSTLAHAVAGLIRPDQGQITLNGRVLFDGRTHLPPHLRRIGYVFQDARLFPHLTVRDNLCYGQKYARGPAIATLDQVADLLGIAHLMARRPATLSGGEAARTALGRALLMAPEALLLDEPLAALDPARKSEILPYFERLQAEIDLPILYISHAPEELARLAHTLVLMDRGRILAQGPTETVLATPAASEVLGPRALGALLPATVTGYDADGLARLDVAGAPVYLDQKGLKTGQKLRLRVHANDVMIARARPEGISALNMIPARVTQITDADAASAYLHLDAGGAPLLAKLTRRSVAALNLRAGDQVVAILKTVSLAPDA